MVSSISVHSDEGTKQTILLFSNLFTSHSSETLVRVRICFCVYVYFLIPWRKSGLFPSSAQSSRPVVGSSDTRRTFPTHHSVPFNTNFRGFSQLLPLPPQEKPTSPPCAGLNNLPQNAQWFEALSSFRKNVQICAK